MISNDDVEEAVHYLAKSAVEFAKAKGRRVWTEAKIKIVKAEQFVALRAQGGYGIAEAEHHALKSKQYAKALDDLRESVESEETLRAYRDAAEARIEVWRTMESSRRAANV